MSAKADLSSELASNAALHSQYRGQNCRQRIVRQGSVRVLATRLRWLNRIGLWAEEANGMSFERKRFAAIHSVPAGTMRRLQVHHMMPYRLRYDNRQENLIPLCRTHHNFVEKLTRDLDELSLSYDESLTVRRCMMSEYQEATRAMLMELWQWPQ
jgi:hypothetical protein